MNDIELGLLERRGALLRKSLDLVRSLAESPLADEDSEEESAEIRHVKDLIVQARSIQDEER